MYCTGMFTVPTYWNSTRKCGAFCLPSRWDMRLHDTVIQEVPWSCVGECRTFKFSCIHFVYETKKWTKIKIVTTLSLIHFKSWHCVLNIKPNHDSSHKQFCTSYITWNYITRNCWSKNTTVLLEQRESQKYFKNPFQYPMVFSSYYNTYIIELYNFILAHER